MAATIGGFAVLVWNRSFLQLWVGKMHYAGTIPNLLIVVSVMQFLLWQDDDNIIKAALDLRLKTALGAAATSTGLASLLVGRFDMGIADVCTGFMAGQAILSLGYPWLVARLLGRALLPAEVSRLWRPTLVTVLLFGLGSTLGALLTARTWFALVPWLAGTFIAAGPAARSDFLGRPVLSRQFRLQNDKRDRPR